MNVAAKLIESPETHAAEIRSITSLDERTLKRLMTIASMYTKVDPASYDEHKYAELLFEMKSIKERLNLWDDLTISRAIRALRDPTGW